MIPCLYEATETKFMTLGIGKLTDCISCSVTEERNGIYELEMEYPTDGIHASDLVNGNIIRCTPSYNTAQQAFRIYKVTTPMDGKLEIAARHISYQLSFTTVSPCSAISTSANDDCSYAFDALKAHASTDVPFDFETDISGGALFTISEPVTFRSALGGITGSMLDTFGGEFEWDMYTVRLLKSRGSDKGVKITYGKDLTDFKKEESLENTITGIHPYWKSEETGELVEISSKIVTFADLGITSTLPYEKIAVLDCTEEFEEAPSEAQLLNYAQSYLETTSYVDPDIDMTVDFAQLWQYPEYSDIAEAEAVNLCDTVTVYCSKLDINVTTYVTETVWDVLLDRYSSITLSTSRTSARNSALQLTLATTSRVRSMIALSDTSIRLLVAETTANMVTTSMLEVNNESILLQFEEKTKDMVTTSMLELSNEGILAEVEKMTADFVTNSTLEMTGENILLEISNTYATQDELGNYVETKEIRTQFAMDNTDISLSAEYGTITFNAGTLVINADNLTLDEEGNATFSGELNAASGTFVGSLTNTNSNGTLTTEIENGKLTFSGSNGTSCLVDASVALSVYNSSGKYVETVDCLTLDAPGIVLDATYLNVPDTLNVGSTGEYVIGGTGSAKFVTNVTQSTSGTVTYTYKTIYFINGIMVTDLS